MSDQREAAGGSVAVVVLGFGEEPWLGECLQAVLDDMTPDDECVLVDNGIGDAARASIPDDARLRVVTPAENLGFAEGCNEGARNTRADVIVFVNSDAVVAPGALAVLSTALSDPKVGLVTASIRLGDRPDTINAAGNPMHYLGFTWAGGMGDPATQHALPHDATCISGATFAIRRSLWEQLGGFDPEYFAYGEDSDLSIRTWQSGHAVRFEPDAVSFHHYEFGRNANKWFLVERGRLINVLTLFEPRTRRLIVPMLVAVEVASLIPAARQGWAPAKIAAWRWLWDNRAYLRTRSARVQASRVVPDAHILSLLSSKVEPPEEFGQHVPAAANAVLDVYWRWVRRRVGVTSVDR